MQKPLPAAGTEDNGSPFFHQFGVHFCLVSGQAAPNFLPVVLYRPARVVLFVSPEMRTAAKHLEDALRRAAPATKVESVSVGDAWDLEACRTLFFEKLAACEAERPVVNVTGGTKIMAFAALTTALDCDVPAFYLNERDNTISVLASRRDEGAPHIAPIPVKTSIRNYLAAYGYDVLESAPAPSLPAGVQDVIEGMLRQASLRDVVSKLNAAAVEAEDRGTYDRRTGRQEKGAPKPVNDARIREDLPEERRNAFDVLCDHFERMGRLRRRGAQLVFPTEADRFFVAGGWLEEYAAAVLARLGLRPECNLVVERGARNEIDVAFMHDGYFHIVECKTCFFLQAEDANKVLYKLESLGRLSGLKTKLVLVSYQPLPDAPRKRAEDMHITVFCGDQLRDLAGCFKGLISR